MGSFRRRRMIRFKRRDERRVRVIYRKNFRFRKFGGSRDLTNETALLNIAMIELIFVGYRWKRKF
jgi:hypothetical protein